MPTFLARRYGRSRDEVSKTERLIGAVVLVVLVGLGGAVVRALTVRNEGAREIALAPAGETIEKAAQPASGQKLDLPRLDKGGWTCPTGVEWYSLETVHKKINGRVGLYEAYEMTGMTFGTYKHPAHEDRYVDVYDYDMGETLNAFGCYKAEFAEDMPAIKIGRGGYRAEKSLFLWKGRHYVQLVAGDSVQDADVPILTELAEQIAAKITDDGKPLWGDALLPKANRKPESLGFELRNALSLDFLRGIFRAEYAEGQAEYSLFIHRAKSPEAARALLDQYAAYLGKHGKISSRQDSPGGRTIVGEVMDVHDYVFCKGPYFGGVSGAEDAKLAAKHGPAFRDGLKAE
ncbi:MAG: hypothetical protein JXQ73_15270 [Phycisphaerae bacterium]|nr:hypothetical protein [Phycisphaerae bacterium]